MLKSSLENAGYSVPAWATTGQMALEQLGEHVPDLILMDIVLEGGIDGIETATLIKKRYSMPIIYLSGYSEDSFIERAKITEPFGYVLKPPRTQELISVIEMALLIHRSRKKRY